MEIKKLRHLSIRLVKLFDTGLNAAEKRNYQYATEIFRNLLKQEPGALEVREKLREMEFKRVGGQVSLVRRLFAPIMTFPNQIKSSKLIKEGKFSEALDNAEAAIKFDPTSINCCLLLARAAEAASLHAIVKQTMEMALKHHPENISLLNSLANTYSEMGMGKKAAECLKKIIKLQPDSDEHKKALKQANSEAALDSINPEILFYYRDNHQKISVDEKSLETQMKVQLNALKKMETVEIRKKLGDLYALKNDYEKALENYNRAIELSTVVDPALDHAVNETLSRQYDASIAEWTTYLNNENTSAEEKEEARQEINRLKKSKSDILIDRTKERYRRNPHSHDICFELAKLLWKNAFYENAITHFRQLTDTTQFKDQAYLFLGKCYFALRKYDQAIEALKSAITTIRRMNSIKKNAYYSLATCYQAMNKIDEADGCYKAIYSVDENYEDVSEIVDKIYEREIAAMN